jgi:hypothetical protein
VIERTRAGLCVCVVRRSCANGRTARWQSIAIKIAIVRFLRMLSMKEGVLAIECCSHGDRTLTQTKGFGDQSASTAIDRFHRIQNNLEGFGDRSLFTRDRSLP